MDPAAIFVLQPEKKRGDVPPQDATPVQKIIKACNAPRCTVCAGRPLRSECVHTKAGAARVHEKNAMESLRAPTPGTVPPTNSQPNSGTNNVVQPISTPVNNPAEGVEQSILSTSVALPDPQTLPHPAPETQTPAANLPPAPEAQTPEARTPAASVPVAFRPPPTSKQVRTSTTDPYNGLVSAQRGNLPYNVVRGHKAPDRHDKTSKSTKAFGEKIDAILEKCDDLSLQTGCWLFIGAQHPTARSAAIHYASHRLRRDAPGQSGQIATQFCQLTQNLLASKNQDMLQLQTQLEESRKRSEAVENELMAAQKDREGLESKLRSLMALYNVEGQKDKDRL
ncbi:hypothetical protein GALMADRAFT_213511 [Galerina marginata CBS 339.88]|uniref:Uncharacterized protein n=1 Tax=Galerina marginata (strain CBS 339.88) TaxID=685588 RepID=A0A067SZ76_GALM3|nr:hypothetical protein GALMADRAFT_213511 [Galerina marginata CBS 339.88]